MENLLFFNWILSNLDLVLLALILGFAVYGAIKGFFAQLVGAITTVVALIVATMFAKPFMNLVINYTPIDSYLQTSFSAYVSNHFPALNSVNIENVASVVEKLPFPDVIKNSVLNFCSTQTSSIINVGEILASFIAKYLILLVCFIILIAVIKLLFLLLRKLGENLREIDIVRSIDNTLGAFLAIFKLYRRLSLIILIISILPLDFAINLQNAVNGSYIATFISEFNLYSWILSILQL